METIIKPSTKRYSVVIRGELFKTQKSLIEEVKSIFWELETHQEFIKAFVSTYERVLSQNKPIKKVYYGPVQNFEKPTPPLDQPDISVIYHLRPLTLPKKARPPFMASPRWSLTEGLARAWGPSCGHLSPEYYDRVLSVSNNHCCLVRWGPAPDPGTWCGCG